MIGSDMLVGGELGAYIYIGIILVIDVALIYMNRTFFRKI